MAKSRATFCCSGAYKKTLNYSVAEIRKRIKSLDMQIAVSTIFSLVKKNIVKVDFINGISGLSFALSMLLRLNTISL